MAPGHWTPGCEKWYQKRLEKIGNGTATLQSAAEWAMSLKFEQKLLQSLFDGLEKESYKFLDHHLPCVDW